MKKFENGTETINFEVIIPKYRNDQTPISQDRINYYKEQIGLFAGGASQIDTKGLFIGQTKKIDFDENITLRIGVPKSIETQTHLFLKLLCTNMAKEFGQEQVWLSKNKIFVDLLEGERDSTPPKKDLIVLKKELQHLFVRFLEEEKRSGGWTKFSLLTDIIRNVYRLGIDINKVNPNNELEYLIQNGSIHAVDMKIKAFDMYDSSVYEYLEDPELSLTAKGKDFYLNADIKSRLLNKYVKELN